MVGQDLDRRHSKPDYLLHDAVAQIELRAFKDRACLRPAGYDFVNVLRRFPAFTKPVQCQALIG